MWSTTGPAVEVIAHRGASADAPEHTLEAYDLALSCGADTLELDVRPTGDGELVIVHDRTLWRTAGDARRVARCTRADLDRLDPRVRPLTLDAVVARYGDQANLLVELKDPDPAWEHGVIDVLRRHGAAERATVQSFDQDALRRMKAASPDVRVAPLFRHLPATSRRLRGLARWADGIGVWHRAIDGLLVVRAHDAGLAVRGWTANASGEVDRLLRLGVDGVITDVPGQVRATVDQVAAAQPQPVAA